MSVSKVLKTIVEPTEWHNKAIGQMEKIHQHPRPSLLGRAVVQAPAKMALNVATIATGAASVARETLALAFKAAVAVGTTLPLGILRIVTWSHVGEKAYQALPGIRSLVHTAERVAAQALGILAGAGVGIAVTALTLGFVDGSRLNVKHQIFLGNYAAPKAPKKDEEPAAEVVVQPKPAVIVPPQKEEGNEAQIPDQQNTEVGQPAEEEKPVAAAGSASQNVVPTAATTTGTALEVVTTAPSQTAVQIATKALKQFAANAAEVAAKARTQVAEKNCKIYSNGQGSTGRFRTNC